MKVLLVRHARPLLAQEHPPAEWALSLGGLDDARLLGALVRQTRDLASAEVVTSTERKALETARCLGLGEMRTDKRAAEVRRPWYEDDRCFERAVCA